MSIRAFYIGTALLITLGAGWLALNLHGTLTASTCMLKNTTGIPCPGCGTTRGIMQLLSGHIVAAWYSNPFSIAAFITMCIIPFWMAHDGLKKKQTMYKAFLNAEAMMKRKPIAILFFGIILSNWIWNIIKANG
ncbi:MAG: DUF2752 domain-containing protein [Chitinophagaceae bacterium]